jgi:hypothetical protein
MINTAFRRGPAAPAIASSLSKCLMIASSGRTILELPYAGTILVFSRGTIIVRSRIVVIT